VGFVSDESDQSRALAAPAWADPPTHPSGPGQQPLWASDPGWQGRSVGCHVQGAPPPSGQVSTAVNRPRPAPRRVLGHTTRSPATRCPRRGWSPGAQLGPVATQRAFSCWSTPAVLRLAPLATRPPPSSPWGGVTSPGQPLRRSSFAAALNLHGLEFGAPDWLCARTNGL